MDVSAEPDVVEADAEEEDDDAVLQRVLAASRREARELGMVLSDDEEDGNVVMPARADLDAGAASEDDADMQLALKLSRADEAAPENAVQEAGEASEDDADLQLALKLSRADEAEPENADEDAGEASEDDAELRRAMELSRREYDGPAGNALISCGVCTFDNPAGSTSCEVCGTSIS